ncbi:hypothetical protein NDU88_005351 [Pleurodeles waltl]|uniref:Uncharacterized protein n=1 Tax=Pleurodeles waltl TaxID=8319 RepID=A0AAV7WY14_PLEWA|nr:hypothetical protein NDU88_005351 [Pleurodeles waltl]
MRQTEFGTPREGGNTDVGAESSDGQYTNCGTWTLFGPGEARRRQGCRWSMQPALRCLDQSSSQVWERGRVRRIPVQLHPK